MIEGLIMEDVNRESLDDIAKRRFPYLHDLTTCICVRETLSGETIVEEPFDEQTKARDELLALVKRLVDVGISEGDVVKIRDDADSQVAGCFGVVKVIERGLVTCAFRFPMSLEIVTLFTVEEESCEAIGSIRGY